MLSPLPDAGRHPSARAYERVLSQAGAALGEVSLVLTTSGELHRLNRRFRGQDRPTDVLAFDYVAGGEAQEGTPREGAVVPARAAILRAGDGVGRVWGDVYVSREAVLEQSREQGIEPREELARLFLHGCLHLLGHRDEELREREWMLAVQEALLPGLLRGGRPARRPARRRAVPASGDAARRGRHR